MGKEYRAKVFKSGNSLALRLPKALGLKEGAEMVVREDRVGFRVEPEIQPRRKFNIDAIWGIGKDLDLKPIRPGDRVFEHRKLLWDYPDWQDEPGPKE